MARRPTLLVIAIAVATVWGTAVEEAPLSGEDIYENVPFDAHLLAFDKAALEEAYKERIAKLFDVWLTSTQARDATNFKNGLFIARRGYNAAAAQIARREQAYRDQVQQEQQR